MQSSLQRTLKVKQASHGTSLTCMLSPSDRQRRAGLPARSSSLYTGSVKAETFLCQELPKLLESILEVSSPVCPWSSVLCVADVHVRYVLLIE